MGEKKGTTKQRLSLIQRMLKHSEDVEAREILLGKWEAIKPEHCRSWRKSMNISLNDMAFMMAVSKRHVIRIEKGEYPINEKYAEKLRMVVEYIREGFPELPKAQLPMYRDPGARDRYVPLGRIAKMRGGEWRPCEWCQKTKFFYTRTGKYCSEKCKKSAARWRKKNGIVPDKKVGGRKGGGYVYCPHCLSIFRAGGRYLPPKYKPAEMGWKLPELPEQDQLAGTEERE